MIVETGYEVDERHPEVMEEGRRQLTRAIHEARTQTNGRCRGIFYWEPLWLPGEGICWASEAGQAYIHEEGKSTENEWANQCLFDYCGNKLPAFDLFNR